MIGKCKAHKHIGMITFIKKKLKNMLPQYFLVRRLPQKAKNCILLTFDDGPHPELTPAVLDRLKKYNARAIFFIPGRCIENAPNLIKIIEKEGHIIGNHTYLHPNGRQPWFYAYYKDLVRCQNELKKHVGRKVKYFRPAGGAISLTSLFTPLIVGLRTVTWSIDAEDWRCRTPEDANHVAKKIIKDIGRRDIILLHDNNPSILFILDAILPVIEFHGFDLKSSINYL